MALIDLKQCVMTIKDGTATPKAVIVKIGEGSLSYDETKTIEYKLDKGKLSNVKQGDEVPLDVKFDFEMDAIQTPTDGAPDFSQVEKILKGGAASGYTSTDADTCRPYACDIEIVFTPDCSGGTAFTKKITLPDFRWEKFSFDFKGSSVACSGKCNVTEALLTTGT